MKLGIGVCTPAMYPDTTSYILIFIVAMSFALLCKFVHPAAFSWQKGE